MSAHNNYGTNNNNEQKELEVEATVGMAYVRGGDSPREGRPPVTTTQNGNWRPPPEVLMGHVGVPTMIDSY